MMNLEYAQKVIRQEPCGCQLLTDNRQLGGTSFCRCSRHFLDALMALPREQQLQTDADHHYQQEMRRS